MRCSSTFICSRVSIEGAERLIEQQNLRIARERPCDRARRRMPPDTHADAGAQTGEADQRQQLARPRDPVRLTP